MKVNNQEIIIDSGFFIALLNKNDQFHQASKNLIKSIANKRWVTTWLVMTEVAHMLIRENASGAIHGMLNLCETGGITLFHLNNIHIPRLKQVMQKYQDLPIDLADASLIILAEELNLGEILSTDRRYFKTYRWKNHKPFTNLFRTESVLK